MAFAVFNVMIPFHREDLSPVRMLVDLIFVEAIPYAVLEWERTTDGRAPSFIIKLDPMHLRKDLGPKSDYLYQQVLKQPRV